MEQSKYLMWMRTKLGGSPQLPALLDPAASSYSYSWEERAFAEDSSGRFGGCVWPPRSYSCSFCRREFRSAQALGGHMNVHRRDRARLKLSPNSQTESSRHLLPQPSLDDQPPSDAVALSLPPLRVSAASTQTNYTDRTLVSPNHGSSLALLKENHIQYLSPISLPYPDQFSLRTAGAPETKVINGCGEDAGADEQSGRRKRKRLDEEIPFLLGSLAGDGRALRSELLGVGPVPVEELDLELRLGDRPLVK